jgi:hypothetical protein
MLFFFFLLLLSSFSPLYLPADTLSSPLFSEIFESGKIVSKENCNTLFLLNRVCTGSQGRRLESFCARPEGSLLILSNGYLKKFDFDFDFFFFSDFYILKVICIVDFILKKNNGFFFY